MKAKSNQTAGSPFTEVFAEWLKDVALAAPLLDEKSACAHLGITRRQLKELRLRGGGPRFVRIGASPRYRIDWLAAYIDANAVGSTAEEIARRRD